MQSIHAPRRLGRLAALLVLLLAGAGPAAAADGQGSGAAATPPTAGAEAPAGDMKMVHEHAAKWQYREPAPLSAAALIGKRLYLEGLRADGSLLAGERRLDHAPSATVQGATAACVSCHRPSGLGSVEGDVLVPPISGRALFEPGSLAVAAETRSKRQLHTAHAPYDSDSLALALRQGRHVSGRPLHAMMPRYTLSDVELQGLEAYLRTLSTTWSPGVSANRVRLASVITPDVDPATRKLAIETLRTFVARKNLATRPGRRHMVSSLEFVLRSERQWELDIWELTGSPDTWGAQLRALQASKPVFAVASGVARDWSPVHAFCESEQLPCWFPVVDSLPATAADDHWGLYFSAGLALEAEVTAGQIQQAGLGRVLQLVDGDGAAQGAAHALAQRLGRPVTTIDVASVDDAALQTSLAGLAETDSVVLWLRPAALARLGRLAPPPAGSVWLGARLSGAERLDLPAPWRERARMVCPYELPGRRAGNMAKLQSWLSTTNKPLVDEVVQSELFFALSYLNESLGAMLHNLHREYLIEQAESMLGRREETTVNADVIAQRSLRRIAVDLGAAQRAAQAALAASAASNAAPSAASAAVVTPSRADLTAAREGTTIYPRLTLGPGQRLASKGAYVLPLAEPTFGARAQWVVP
ncbi:MAG: hypothetical protein RIQ60_1949 [Pseudomonadota bacterium]|jgi:cytochrome c553